MEHEKSFGKTALYTVIGLITIYCTYIALSFVLSFTFYLFIGKNLGYNSSGLILNFLSEAVTAVVSAFAAHKLCSIVIPKCAKGCLEERDSYKAIGWILIAINAINLLAIIADGYFLSGTMNTALIVSGSLMVRKAK